MLWAGVQSVFVERAVRRFHEQDHVRRDLLVCAPDRSHDDLAGHRVRVVHAGLWPRLEDPATLSPLLDDVRSELIAWWDPLDWMGPGRLSHQVAALAAEGAVGAVATDVLGYVLHRGDALTVRGPAAGSVMVSTERLRQVVGDRGTLSPGELTSVVDPAWYLRVVERAPRGLSQRRPFAEVVGRVGTDLQLYAAWRARRTPPAARPRAVPSTTAGPAKGIARDGAPRPRPLRVAAPLIIYDGFGSMGEYLLRSITRAGVAVNATPLRIDRSGLHPDTLTLVDRASPRPTDPTLCLAWVGQPLGQFASARPLFVNSMWESDTLPAGFADGLNTARAVIVPSTWVREVFRSNGVRVPIEVVPQGVDPQRYRPARGAPHQRRGLTTLVVAAFTARKNIPESIAAWKAAFTGDAGARLLIKSRFQLTKYTPDDPRITFVDEQEPTAGIAHWYARADVVMALGGEGFGLPLVEAMACGLPVVALDAQGQHDVVAAAGDRVLPVPAAAWVPYDDGSYRVGRRAVPDVRAAAAALRWVADHREEAAHVGARASAWALARRNIWDMGPGIITAMRGHLRPGELDFAATAAVDALSTPPPTAPRRGAVLAGQS